MRLFTATAIEKSRTQNFVRVVCLRVDLVTLFINPFYRSQMPIRVLHTALPICPKNEKTGIAFGFLQKLIKVIEDGAGAHDLVLLKLHCSHLFEIEKERTDMRIATNCVTVVAALLFVAQSFANNISYVESVDGEIGDPSSVTDMGVAGFGSNTVTGIIENTTLSSGFDADVFSFTIEPGHQLQSIAFAVMESNLMVESQHLIAFNDGPVDTVAGLDNIFIGLVTSSFVGQNFLTSTDDLFGSPPVGGPLGPGTYHVWFQETLVTEDVNYTIEIQVVPEPTSAFLVVMIGVGAALRRSR